MNWTWVDKTDDRSGLQWRYRITDHAVVVYIPGTDHPDDWKHHGKIRLIEAANGIWVTKADLELAADIIRTVSRLEKELIYVGGHSWGGAVAALIVWSLRRRGAKARGWLYGPKQAGNAEFVRVITPYITAYRRRGDVVPVLIPWLARFPMEKIGKLTWPWSAHGPDTYYGQMADDGFR